ncbi:MAG: hypothetical protein AB7K09_23730 [Planctomycetota bacterium]
MSRNLPYLAGIETRYDSTHPSINDTPAEFLAWLFRVMIDTQSISIERADPSWTGPTAIFRDVALNPTDPVVTLPFQFALGGDSPSPVELTLKEAITQYHVNLYVEQKGSEYADQIETSHAFQRYALLKRVEQSLIVNDVTVNPEATVSLDGLIDFAQLGRSSASSGNILNDLNEARWNVTALDGDELGQLIYLVNTQTMKRIDDALTAAGLEKTVDVFNGRPRRHYGGVPFVISDYIEVPASQLTKIYCALMHPTNGVFLFVHKSCPEPVKDETTTELAPFKSFQMMWNIELASAMDRSLMRITDVDVSTPV